MPAFEYQLWVCDMEGIWLCLGFYPDMDKALVAKEQYPIETQTYRIVKVQLAS